MAKARQLLLQAVLTQQANMTKLCREQTKPQHQVVAYHVTFETALQVQGLFLAQAQTLQEQDLTPAQSLQAHARTIASTARFCSVKNRRSERAGLIKLST